MRVYMALWDKLIRRPTAVTAAARDHVGYSCAAGKAPLPLRMPLKRAEGSGRDLPVEEALPIGAVQGARAHLNDFTAFYDYYTARAYRSYRGAGNGPIAQALGQFELRLAQIQMLQAVVNALNEHERLMVEPPQERAITGLSFACGAVGYPQQ